MIMARYIIRKIQIIYADGSRDRSTLSNPIHTDDKEAVRAKLKIRHTSVGMKCVGVNLDYDELNDYEL